jgi:hypothetical protein
MAGRVSKAKKSTTTVDIRPQVPMYAAFARLNYKPWFAFAELVDNALQSFLHHEKALAKTKAGYTLKIAIDISADVVRITDNAAGIDSKEFERALSPAAAPANDTGLSEFGLGLKAAACWLAKRWSIRTSALGEPLERTVDFDIPEIVRSKRERLDVVQRTVAKETHFTVIELRDLNVGMKTRALGKIRSHLASIYRVFLREGRLELTVAGETLHYEEPALLIAPAAAGGATSKSIEWRKDIDLKISKQHRISGWAGLLSTASVTNAGFAVFRRGRLVIGSHGEAYRPEFIFKKPNSYTYQRLVGELTVEGFSVSHTKDGLLWDDNEEEVLAALKKELDKSPLALLKQAENYRVNAKARNSGAEAVRGPSRAPLQHLSPMPTARMPAVSQRTKSSSIEFTPAKSSIVHLSVRYARRKWAVSVQLVDDEARNDWYDFTLEESEGASRVTTRVNLAHPFMRDMAQSASDLQPLLRVVAALAIAEIAARVGGQAGAVRRNTNDILRVGFTSK